jgi:1-acyl-sn-glycerol-3-phosphate acyltransferase
VSLAIAALRSLAVYVTVSLYTLAAGPPLLAFAALTGRLGPLYRAGLAGVRLGLWLSGIRYRVVGAEHIQRHRAAVYCVNHSSNLEPPILFVVLRDLFPNLRILYKAELRKLPVLGKGFDMAGWVAVERGNPEQSVPAVDAAARALGQGASFVIFPEGTRSRTGELLPFKKGGFVMAIKAQVPVVPVAILGAREAMRKGSPVIRPVTVSVRIGEPIETRGLTLADRERLVTTARARVAALLAEGPIPATAPPSGRRATDRRPR